MERRSIELTEKQWLLLDGLAVETKSKAEKGPRKGEYSWRTLIRLIAVGKIKVAVTPS